MVKKQIIKKALHSLKDIHGLVWNLTTEKVERGYNCRYFDFR